MKTTASRHASVLLTFLLTSHASASTIWDGPDLTVVNPSNAGVQDMITSNVILTRGSTAGMYNAAQEVSYDQVGLTSPLGTQWAFQGLNGNPSNAAQITASNFANLVFSNWANALGGSPELQGNIVNRPGVVHLVSEDIYLNIKFTNWGGGGTGGAFTYVRSTVPEPTSLAILAGCTMLGLTVRRRRSSSVVM